MSYDWNSLDIKEKIMLVTTDIMHLLDKLCEKTRPGGVVDSAIETASESFEHLGKLLQVDFEEEDDNSINLNTLLQDISSGQSVVNSEVARLLSTSFKRVASSPEKSVGNKGLSTSSQSEQVNRYNKRTDDLLDSRHTARHSVSVIDEVLLKRSLVKDQTQLGPSDLLAQGKDASVREKFSKQSFRDLSQPGPSGMTSKGTSKERWPKDYSADLSQPSPQRKDVSVSKQSFRDLSQPGPTGMTSKVSSKERWGDKSVELSQPGPRRKDASLSKQSFRDLSQPGPSGMTSKVTGKERWPRDNSADLSQPGPSGINTRNVDIEKDKLLKRSSLDQSESRNSKARKKPSGSKRTLGSTSVYESYTHYSPEGLRKDSNEEAENDHRRSSTIY